LHPPEYAQVFKTVCVDAAYYKFPDRAYLGSLVSVVPKDFQFTFKVTDAVTIKRFPNKPRFGARAGKPNEDFLNADLFANAFITPCEEFRKNVSLLIFEFSRFSPNYYQHCSGLVADLDRFLRWLPARFRTALASSIVKRFKRTDTQTRWNDDGRTTLESLADEPHWLKFV
jgi:uncharacterized protein YecE (DUF72 family)